MNWIVGNVKWLMLVAGALTCTMLYAAISPQAQMRTRASFDMLARLSAITIFSAAIARIAASAFVRSSVSSHDPSATNRTSASTASGSLRVLSFSMVEMRLSNDGAANSAANSLMVGGLGATGSTGWFWVVSSPGFLVPPVNAKIVPTKARPPTAPVRIHFQPSMRFRARGGGATAGIPWLDRERSCCI